MLTKKRVLAIAAVLVAGSFYLQPCYSARPVLTGEVAEERVKQLSTEIPWHDSLKDAEADAQKSGKLIFWMHMLGHIDGAT